MNLSHARIAAVFNEWARRYAENPEGFGEIIGADGKPLADYGERCAHYFGQIAGEIDPACPEQPDAQSPNHPERKENSREIQSTDEHTLQLQ